MRMTVMVVMILIIRIIVIMIIVIRETVHLWFLEKSWESGSTGCPPPPPPQCIGTPKIKIKIYSQRFIF